MFPMRIRRISMFLGPPGSVSGSVSQRYGYEDPDPDPYQNVTDPQHNGWVPHLFAVVLFRLFWLTPHPLSRLLAYICDTCYTKRRKTRRKIRKVLWWRDKGKSKLRRQQKSGSLKVYLFTIFFNSFFYNTHFINNGPISMALMKTLFLQKTFFLLWNLDSTL